jgi:hypothetical protein
MTTKQIAEYLGKPERTVRDWVKALSAKSAEVLAKIAEARATSKPADYDLAETCQIIEEGMGKDVADVYRTNAVNAEMAKAPTRPVEPPSSLPDWRRLKELRLLAEGGYIDARQVQLLIGAPISRRMVNRTRGVPLRIPTNRPARAAQTSHSYEEGVSIIEKLTYPIKVRDLGKALDVCYATISYCALDLGIKGGGYDKEKALTLWYALYWGREAATQRLLPAPK